MRIYSDRPCSHHSASAVLCIQYAQGMRYEQPASTYLIPFIDVHDEKHIPMNAKDLSDTRMNHSHRNSVTSYQSSYRSVSPHFKATASSKNNAELTLSSKKAIKHKISGTDLLWQALVHDPVWPSDWRLRFFSQPDHGVSNCTISNRIEATNLSPETLSTSIG